MAVNKADIVTNADDLDTQNEKGHYSCVRGISSHIALSGAASDNDIILFHEIPVDALIDSIVLNSDDLGTTGDINIGFYPGQQSMLMQQQFLTLKSDLKLRTLALLTIKHGN
jgi:hypothetical protein